MASPRKDSPDDKKDNKSALPKSGRHVVAQRSPEAAPDAQASSPELRVGFGPAGTETMEAITEELARKANDDAPVTDAPVPMPRHHEIVIDDDEKTLPRAARVRVNTFSYGDRLSNAPGAVIPPAPGAPPSVARAAASSRAPLDQPAAPASKPSKPPIPPRPRNQAKPSRPPPEPVPREPFTLSSPDLRRQAQISISEIEGDKDPPVISLVDDGEPATGVRSRLQTMDFAERPRSRDTAPEVITIEERPIGRETLAAIAEELARENAAFLRNLPQEDGALEIMEMATFVVRGSEVQRLSSEAARREFVAQRLIHRLPVDSLDKVDRIDVTPWTVRGTVVLRVWCRVETV